MKYRVYNKGEKYLHYKITKWKKNGNLYIIHKISEDISLIKLMDKVGNVNNEVSIVEHWIFISNYKKALPLTTE